MRAVGDILAVLDGMDARGIRHVLVDDLADAEGGVDMLKIEPLADRLDDGLLGGLPIEPDAAAGKIVGIELPSTRSASVTVGCGRRGRNRRVRARSPRCRDRL